MVLSLKKEQLHSSCSTKNQRTAPRDRKGPSLEKKAGWWISEKKLAPQKIYGGAPGQSAEGGGGSKCGGGKGNQTTRRYLPGQVRRPRPKKEEENILKKKKKVVGKKKGRTGGPSVRDKSGKKRQGPRKTLHSKRVQYQVKTK